MADMADVITKLHHANTRINDAEHEIKKIHDWIETFCKMRPIYSDEKIVHMKAKNQVRNKKRNEKREEKRALKRDAAEDQAGGGPEP